ncbi:MAG: DNA-directed RNA polymerase subunit K [Candidatus Aenigmatarchaeota archaeon]
MVKKILKDDRMIWPVDRLTRFEFARILGARALQISLGAPVLVKTDATEPVEIAKAEFKEKVVPITVKRKLPSGEEMIINIKKAMENWIEEHGGNI